MQRNQTKRRCLSRLDSLERARESKFNQADNGSAWSTLGPLIAAELTAGVGTVVGLDLAQEIFLVSELYVVEMSSGGSNRIIALRPAHLLLDLLLDVDLVALLRVGADDQIAALKYFFARIFFFFHTSFFSVHLYCCSCSTVTQAVFSEFQMMMKGVGLR